MLHKMSDPSTLYNWQYMLLRDDHKMTLSILMNVLAIESITNTSASYRNFASCEQRYSSMSSQQNNGRT